jgi:hypothetical protein
MILLLDTKYYAMMLMNTKPSFHVAEALFARICRFYKAIFLLFTAMSYKSPIPTAST